MRCESRQQRALPSEALFVWERDGVAYSAEQKALAIALIHRYGGMTADALDAVEAALGKRVSTSTLHSWLPKAEAKDGPKSESATEKKKRTPGATVTPELQAQAEQALDDMFEAVARKYLAHAAQDDIVADTKGKDAVITAATAVDKMRLLRDLPTEIVGLMPAVVAALEAAGMDPVTTFERLVQRAQERARERVAQRSD